LEVRAAHSHTHERPLIWRFAGLAAPESLIGCLQTGSGWLVEPGWVYTPTAKGSRSAGWTEPFAPLRWAFAFAFERALLPLVARGPRPGCWSLRRGPASLRRLGERVIAPSRSTRRATSCSVLSIWPQSPLPPPAEGRFVSRRSDGCPSLSVAALKHPVSSTARPLLRRRSSRRTRVGRAWEVSLSLKGRECQAIGRRPEQPQIGQHSRTADVRTARSRAEGRQYRCRALMRQLGSTRGGGRQGGHGGECHWLTDSVPVSIP
jgi:hypothetical protein